MFRYLDVDSGDIYISCHVISYYSNHHIYNNIQYPNTDTHKMQIMINRYLSQLCNEDNKWQLNSAL